MTREEYIQARTTGDTRVPLSFLYGIYVDKTKDTGRRPIDPQAFQMLLPQWFKIYCAPGVTIWKLFDVVHSINLVQLKDGQTFIR